MCEKSLTRFGSGPVGVPDRDLGHELSREPQQLSPADTEVGAADEARRRWLGRRAVEHPGHAAPG